MTYHFLCCACVTGHGEIERFLIKFGHFDVCRPHDQNPEAPGEPVFLEQVEG